MTPPSVRVGLSASVTLIKTLSYRVAGSFVYFRDFRFSLLLVSNQRLGAGSSSRCGWCRILATEHAPAGTDSLGLLASCWKPCRQEGHPSETLLTLLKLPAAAPSFPSVSAAPQ